MKFAFNLHLTWLELLGMICAAAAGCVAGGYLQTLGFSHADIQVVALAVGLGVYALLEREVWLGVLALVAANTVLRSPFVAAGLLVLIWGWVALMLVRLVVAIVQRVRGRLAARKGVAP